MDQAKLTTFLNALRAETVPEAIEGPPTGEQLEAGMRDVFRVEERLVDCVAAGVAFVELGNIEVARSAFELAGRWFDVWACSRAHGIQVPFSELPGRPFYEAAKFVLAHGQDDGGDASTALSVPNAVRWMEWAEELSPRVGEYIDLHARLLLHLDRRAEAVRRVSRHRRRYPDDSALDELSLRFAADMEAVDFDDEAEIERRLLDRRIKKETRDYILGHATDWPEGARTYTPVFDALLDASIPDDHPTMRRLLTALGENDGRELSYFVESCLHPLANLPEVVRRTLCFVEPAGFRGWELVRRALPPSLTEHWIEGVWSYLDAFGPRESFVDRAWAVFEDGRVAYVALLQTVDPDWTQRICTHLETARETEAKELLILLGPDHVESGYLQLVTKWLHEHVGAQAERIVAWLQDGSLPCDGPQDEDALLARLEATRPMFAGDVRSWRNLPEGDFFRRATRLSCAFDIHAVHVELERRKLAAFEVPQLEGYISVEGQIELLLGELKRAEEYFGFEGEELEAAELDESKVPDEEEWRLPPIRRHIGRALLRLVAENPQATRRALERVARLPYREGLPGFLRGLELLTTVAPDVHREWVLAQSSPGEVRDWVFEWVAADPDALTWAHRKLGTSQHELALLICARRRDETSIDALSDGYRDRPALRGELGDALAALDPAFTTRRAFEARAAAHRGKTRSPLRKGQQLPPLRWPGGGALDDATRRYLLHIVANGGGQRQEAAALVACLNTEGQRTLAHALYIGAGRKPKHSYMPAFVLPFGDGRLAACFAEDVLEADLKVERRDYLDRIRWAKELLRGLATLGARDELAKLAPRIWNDDLRAVLLEHITPEAMDRAPSKVDFAWLFGAWAGGAWWVPTQWPFEPDLARKLLWYDGTQSLLWGDGFRTLEGLEVEPDRVQLALGRSALSAGLSAETAVPSVPKSVRRNLLGQLDVRETPRDPAADQWDECMGHGVGLARMRRLLRRRGWRTGAIDREMIYDSFYWEVPRIEQGVELCFRHAGFPIPANASEDHQVLLGLTFYSLGSAHRPRHFPKGAYLRTEFDDAPPLRLREVNGLFFHHAVTVVRAVMKSGSGFDPEWQNRY